jgi:hypothetical protein
MRIAEREEKGVLRCGGLIDGSSRKKTGKIIKSFKIRVKKMGFKLSLFSFVVGIIGVLIYVQVRKERKKWPQTETFSPSSLASLPCGWRVAHLFNTPRVCACDGRV